MDRFVAHYSADRNQPGSFKRIGRQGIFDLSNETHLDKILAPLLDTHLPHVSGFMLADTDRNEYNLLKINGEWSSRPHDRDL